MCGGAVGASNFLSVWNATSYIAPTTVKQVGYYTSRGCYESTTGNGTNAKLILSSAQYTNATGMTVETCVGYCITKNYGYAGLSYAKQCYCGSSLLAEAEEDDLSKCNMPCSGSSREFCGAYAKMNVYGFDQSSVNSNGVPEAMNESNTATITANTTAPA